MYEKEKIGREDFLTTVDGGERWRVMCGGNKNCIHFFWWYRVIGGSYDMWNWNHDTDYGNLREENEWLNS